MLLAFHLSQCQLVTHGKSYLLGLNKTQEAGSESQVPGPQPNNPDSLQWPRSVKQDECE